MESLPHELDGRLNNWHYFHWSIMFYLVAFILNIADSYICRYVLNNSRYKWKERRCGWGCPPLNSYSTNLVNESPLRRSRSITLSCRKLTCSLRNMSFLSVIYPGTLVGAKNNRSVSPLRRRFSPCERLDTYVEFRIFIYFKILNLDRNNCVSTCNCLFAGCVVCPLTLVKCY